MEITKKLATKIHKGTQRKNSIKIHHYKKLLQGRPDASRDGILEKSPPGRRRQRIRLGNSKGNTKCFRLLPIRDIPGLIVVIERSSSSLSLRHKVLKEVLSFSGFSYEVSRKDEEKTNSGKTEAS